MVGQKHYHVINGSKQECSSLENRTAHKQIRDQELLAEIILLIILINEHI